MVSSKWSSFSSCNSKGIYDKERQTMISGFKKNNLRNNIKTLATIVLFTILSGCSKCKPNGSPASVTLTESSGQCILDANITCNCTGGGVLSTCSDASQTFNQGNAVSGLAAPCPSTFSCDQLSNCSS